MCERVRLKEYRNGTNEKRQREKCKPGPYLLKHRNAALDDSNEAWRLEDDTVAIGGAQKEKWQLRDGRHTKQTEL